MTNLCLLQLGNILSINRICNLTKKTVPFDVHGSNKYNYEIELSTIQSCERRKCEISENRNWSTNLNFIVAAKCCYTQVSD